MNALPKVDMFKVTRLTREGRLEEAMAALRGARPDASPASEFAGDAGADGGAARILDMAPPSKETGDSWTSPDVGDTRAADGSRRAAGPQFADRFRRILGHAAAFRPTSGPDDLARRATGRRPAPLPHGASFDERTFANEAGSRSYKLYVPRVGKAQALPLVIMLHGCTQSPDDFAAGTRMNKLAEEQNFLVAYPAQERSANVSKCWNWFRTGDQQRDGGEPSLIAGITRQIIRDVPVQPGRVYVAGLSAGGAAAAIMGSAYPDLYAAIGVHSGLVCGAANDVTSAFAAMRRGLPTAAASGSHEGSAAIPTIVFHGDGDTTVNPINGDQVIARSKAGAELRTSVVRGEDRGISYTRTIHADERGRAILEQWVLHGAGHAWSGGSTEGSYTEPRGPDASREMMRFFLRHSTPGASVF